MNYSLISSQVFALVATWAQSKVVTDVQKSVESSGHWSKENQSGNNRKRKQRKRKKERDRKEKKKTKEGKNNENKESSRRVGDLGWGREGSKVGRGSKKAGTRNTLQVNSCLW